MIREMGDSRVLVIVEDEPDMRLVLRAHLRADPRIEIEGEAADAETAIELARQMPPGVVILDHWIEGPITGLEAAPMLKAVAPDAKIILFTAFDVSQEAEAEPAVDVFLPKSQIGQLLSTVQRLLGLDPLPKD